MSNTCGCGKPLADFHEAFVSGQCVECHAVDNAPWLSPGVYATRDDLSHDLSFVKDVNMAVRVHVTGDVARQLLGGEHGPRAFICGQVHWLNSLLTESYRVN